MLFFVFSLLFEGDEYVYCFMIGMKGILSFRLNIYDIDVYD